MKKKKRRATAEPVPSMDSMDPQTRATFVRLVNDFGFKFDAYLDPDIRRVQGALSPTTYARLLVNLMSYMSVDLAIEAVDLAITTVDRWMANAREGRSVVWSEFGFNYRRATTLFETRMSAKLVAAAEEGNVTAIKLALQWRDRERYATDKVVPVEGGTRGGTGIVGPRTVRLFRVRERGAEQVQIGDGGAIDVTPDGEERRERNGRYPGEGRNGR